MRGQGIQGERTRRQGGRWNVRQKGHYFDIALLSALALFFCWFFVGRFGIFGSKVDWISQHSVIPELFRQQFYETGDLFPEFAANFGGGQNIYHFAYYGLYSPVILLSYLFPAVEMANYLMAASVCIVALTAVIFYGWLKSRGFSRGICFWTALMLLLAGPVIFQSSRHVMFVNYLPFLCLAMWGIDRYIWNGKAILKGSPFLYITSVFLMILTSFYFSIGGLLALCIYGLHRYIAVREEEKEEKGGIRRFLKDVIRFLLPMFTAVLMSAFLLIPVASALTGTREGASVIDSASLFLPDFSVYRLMYSSYGIGLTAAAAVFIMAGFAWKRWSSRVLIWGCTAVLILPFFAWVLNGGLYPRDKALIPFLPLVCYVEACYYQRMKRSAEERDGRMSLGGAVPYVLIILLIFCESGYSVSELADTAESLIPELLSGGLIGSSYQWLLLLLDAGFMLLFYLVFVWKKKISLLMVPPAVFLMAFGISFHGTANIESRDFYADVTDEKIEQAVETVLAQEDGFYRMELYGTYAENMANVNRIFSTDQYVTSVYSSTYHVLYHDFCTDTYGIEEPTRNFLIQQVSQNPSFQNLMGVKYLVARESSLSEKQKERLSASGYQVCYTLDGITVYEKENVCPVAYVADRTIPEEEYEKLEFPYNQIALNHYAVTEAGSARDGSWKEELARKTVKLQPELSENGETVVRSGENYLIQSDESQVTTLQLSGDLEALSDSPYVLYLQFDVENKKPYQELAVSVEGVQNKLSSASHLYKNDNTVFTYAVPMQAGKKEVEISFGKGSYEISDILCYAEVSSNASGSNVRAEFLTDQERTEGNVICGTVETQETGYFVTSIPYEENFEVTVDGKKIVYGRVNGAFLGFLLQVGSHEIEIVYHAPGVAEGKMAAVIGFGLFVLQLVFAAKRRSSIA